jgi:hypothetical protein
MKWAGHTERMGEIKKFILIGKSEENKQLGRSKRRREDNIKLDLKEILCKNVEGYDWLRTEHKCDSCKHGIKHSGSIKGRKFPD